jgi:hypothetical protein
VYGLTPWLGSTELTVGKHTLRVVAVDKNGNERTVSVDVEKVPRGTLKRTRTVRFALPKAGVLAAGCATSRRCTADFGRLKPVTAGPTPQGKVAVEWQWRDAKGAWHKLVGGDRPASKPLVFSTTLPRRGAWRVRAAYPGAEEYKAAQSRSFTFRAR